MRRHSRSLNSSHHLNQGKSDRVGASGREGRERKGGMGLMYEGALFRFPAARVSSYQRAENFPPPFSSDEGLWRSRALSRAIYNLT